jgi:hypothetical protein
LSSLSILSFIARPPMMGSAVCVEMMVLKLE